MKPQRRVEKGKESKEGKTGSCAQVKISGKGEEKWGKKKDPNRPFEGGRSPFMGGGGNRGQTGSTSDIDINLEAWY